MSIISGPGSVQTNAFLNLIFHQSDIDEIYLYSKDPCESKYHLLIKKREDAGIKHCNDPKAFMEYSNTMDDIYDNIDNYNPNRSLKILIVFDDIIADMNTNKKFHFIVKELFIGGRKLNTSLAFITQSYFPVPKKRQIKLYTLSNNEDS